MLNNQPISKPFYQSSGLLEVFDIFYTIQGEGIFAGCPAVFVRLNGCNLRCPKCDTDYTSQVLKVSPEYILKRVKKLTPSHFDPLVVITGGEPFRQNITPLVKLLVENSVTVQVETNGTLHLDDFPYAETTIVCSPKTGAVNKKLWPHVDALKYVVHADQIDPEDGLPLRALDHSASPATAKPPEDFFGCIYVQPIDVDDAKENARHLDAAIRSCMQHGYILCVQVHKIINME